MMTFFASAPSTTRQLIARFARDITRDERRGIPHNVGGDFETSRIAAGLLDPSFDESSGDDEHRFAPTWHYLEEERAA